MRILIRVALLSVGAVLNLTTPVICQDVRGANSVLSEVEAAHPKPIPPKVKPDTPIATLRKMLKNSNLYSGKSPVQAATMWMDILSQCAKLAESPSRDDSRMPISVSDAWSALPSPASWPDISRLLEVKYPINSKQTVAGYGNRLAGHILVNNVARQWQDLGAIESLVASGNLKAQLAASSFIEIYRNLAKRSGDPKRILQAVEIEIAQSSYNRGGSTTMPDLVSMVGASKAEEILRKALLTSSVSLSIQQGDETKKLARRLAVEMISQIKAPQWQLIDSIENASLYPIMEKRFKSQAKSITTKTIAQESGQGDSGRASAMKLYYQSLIAKGDFNAASKLHDSVEPNNDNDNDNDNFYYNSSSKRTPQQYSNYDEFYYRLVLQNPTSSNWKSYNTVAIQAGKSDRFIALLRKSITARKPEDPLRSQLSRYLIKALLSVGQLDEAVSLMKSTVSGKTDAAASYSDGNSNSMANLVDLGILKKRDDWVEFGLAGLTKEIEEQGDEVSRSNPMGSSTLLDRLLKLKRYGAAENLIQQELIRIKMLGPNQNHYPDADTVLGSLVNLYITVGKYQSALDVVDKSPMWTSRDIVLSNNYSGNDSEINANVGFSVATALMKTGKPNLAVPILKQLIYRHPGIDRNYKLLIEIQGKSCIPFLDEVYSYDRFEERPLIWKAQILLDDGQYAEAERFARAAISVDPSDGEEGKGDRMRAYAVLADIRDKLGDAKQAEFFRGAVAAIRLSEDADDYVAAGLISEAVKMYEKSLTLFADAYCIQSRLAVQLAAEGKLDEAEAHYRRAFELMPDSFGRMESHCLGCEHVFEGKKSESIAEKVFMDMMAKQPKKPQVHYMLAYLRKEQGRLPEALKYFREAVRLDPDYINAWKKIMSLADQIHVPQTDLDQCAFNLLRLDPLQRHDPAGFDQVANLKGLWEVAEVTSKIRLPELPKSLYPFPAAAAKLDSSGQTDPPMDEDAMAGYSRYNRYGNVSKDRSPSSLVGSNRMLMYALSIATGNMNYRGRY